MLPLVLPPPWLARVRAAPFVSITISIAIGTTVMRTGSSTLFTLVYSLTILVVVGMNSSGKTFARQALILPILLSPISPKPSVVSSSIRLQMSVGIGSGSIIRRTLFKK